METKKAERIDFRVTAEEKELFLRALALSGERTLSAFLIRVLKEKATEIVVEHKRILDSERDRKLFFDAIYADNEPNELLSAAAERYKSVFK